MVAVQIVDRFEPVEIDHRQQAALPTVELRLDVVDEGQPAAQSGKIVGFRLILRVAPRIGQLGIGALHSQQRRVRIVLGLEQPQLRPMTGFGNIEIDGRKDDRRDRSRDIGCSEKIENRGDDRHDEAEENHP